MGTNIERSVRRPTPRIGAALSRPATRLLRAMSEAGAVAWPDPAEENRVTVQAPRGGISLGRGHHAATSIAELAEHDLVEPADGDRRGGRRISEMGRARFRRLDAGEVQTPFGAQHRDVRLRSLAGERPERVSVNQNESPLDWLRRRRGPDGEPLIDAAAFEAGERLRRDLTFAGMLPSVTARWDGAIGSGSGGLRDPASATDATIAARQRVGHALGAVGAEFADLLVDLCGFLKGLETIERDRRWPARSGKVVVRLALGQLARHYGLGNEARGLDAARRVRAWSAEGASGPACCARNLILPTSTC